MNSIDLLDKLNLPIRIGLVGEEALFNQKTIMDAYLSAASLQFNRNLFGLDSSCNWVTNEKAGNESMFSLNQISSDLPKMSPSFDLFKMLGAENPAFENTEDIIETKIVLDIMKIKDYPLTDLHDGNRNILQYQEASNSQNETESESYTKLEQEIHRRDLSPLKKGKKKVDRSDINHLVSEERRRLLKKLQSCDNNRLIFKRRVKNSKKDPKISADTYRGSRFWGVSKNKSKWQVSVFVLYVLIKHPIGNDYTKPLQGVQRWIRH